VRRLLTIGYEDASVTDFIATLTALRVTTLLDIREIASSRRKGFAKTALRDNLTRAGIAYRHEPDLGSPRDIRHRLRENGGYERFFRDFDRYLATQNNLLARLAGELTGTVALLCYERDHHECHRKSVAAVLGKLTGLTPRHHEVQSHGPVQARAGARARPVRKSRKMAGSRSRRSAAPA
jgi:uncharacterized protein (DUF488 family)